MLIGKVVAICENTGGKLMTDKGGGHSVLCLCIVDIPKEVAWGKEAWGRSAHLLNEPGSIRQAASQEVLSIIVTVCTFRLSIIAWSARANGKRRELCGPCLAACCPDECYYEHERFLFRYI